MSPSYPARGALFFSWFMPSFTRLGYALRRLTWSTRSFDFAGQTWLITGASTGIGRHLALSAANAGATVHVVARNTQKLKQLEAEVSSNRGQIVCHSVDLSLMSSVGDLAADFGASNTVFDVLVNNVGLMLNQRSSTLEGIETGFATNVLGHYLLTEQLISLGTLKSGSTVISMSSGGMYNVALDINALQGNEPYDGTLTYARHKRAQVALNEHWRHTYGDMINFYAMHPGWVSTPGVETAMPEFHKLLRRLLRHPAAGADTAMWLAFSKPEQQDAGNIWFDRAQRSPHFFSGTRRGDSSADLIHYLQSLAERSVQAA
ncbi:MAG: SDR family NAD(P)-dependent oxidoreductase [bacterium]